MSGALERVNDPCCGRCAPFPFGLESLFDLLGALLLLLLVLLPQFHRLPDQSRYLILG